MTGLVSAPPARGANPPGPEYQQDPGSGVWQRPGVSDIAYSDGAALEERLLQTVRACQDRSVLSRELALQIRDWPSEYHFSATRANLVRPLGFSAADSILELGGGCGAITRALGETGATVVSVEGTLARARVAASRCDGLPNVAVTHDTIAGFRSPSRFDVVTLIGVLEYAPLYFKGADPIAECLSAAAAHLRPGGRLVVAIENQLGLKYLAGCSEDHLGRRYFGIHDLYGPGTPVTFGRLELCAKLRAAGLRDVESIYPFPDYKLPTVLVHENALREPGLRIGDLLARTQSRDYRDDRLRAFDESLAWQAIGRNGLVGELANSFLMIATRADVPVQGRSRPWLAKMYAVDRRPEYATETTLERAESGHVVRKARLVPGLGAPSALMQALTAHPYQSGQLLVTDLHRIFVDDFDLDKVARWAAPWVSFLQGKAAAATEPLDAQLPGLYVDCTPFNIVRGDAGLVYIDAEWEWETPIPLHWVLVRGLAYSANRWLLSDRNLDLTFRQLITKVLHRLGLEIGPGQLQAATELENTLIRRTRPAERGATDFEAFLDTRLARHTPAFERAQAAVEAQRAADAAVAEVRRVKQSLSWQITKPLRFTVNLLSGRLFRRHEDPDRGQSS